MSDEATAEKSVKTSLKIIMNPSPDIEIPQVGQ